MEWTEAGVVGAYRFVQRLYRLAEVGSSGVPMRPPEFGAGAMALRRVTHRTIAAVTTALESFAYNVAVARMYELAAAIGDADREAADSGMAFARREAVEIAARLVAPMMPHLAEEIFSRLPGTSGLLAQAPWPEANPLLVAAETVTIAVQVNGTNFEIVGVSPRLEQRRRDVLRLYAGLVEAQITALVGADRLPARDYRLTAVALVGATDGLLIDWLSTEPRPDREPVIRELLAIGTLLEAGLPDVPETAPPDVPER